MQKLGRVLMPTTDAGKQLTVGPGDSLAASLPKWRRTLGFVGDAVLKSKVESENRRHRRLTSGVHVCVHTQAT